MPHFFDHAELSFEPVDMLFFVDEDFLEQFAGGIVSGFDAGFDGAVQPFDRLELERQVVLKLCLDIVADLERKQGCQVRQRVQE